MNYIAKAHEKEYKVELKEVNGNQAVAVIDGESIPIQLIETDGSHIYSAMVGNRSFELEIRKNETGLIIHYQGNSFKFFVEDERMTRLKRLMGHSATRIIEKELKAPMPGLIVTIEVKPGQKVKIGDGLLIIEAMKMENEIKAPFDATIKSIKVKEREAVDKNQVLIEFA